MGWTKDLILLVRRVVKAVLSDEVHTHLPAEVISYNAALNTCSVQPCINRIRTDDPDNLTTVKLPQLDDVPVKQFGSGKCLMSIAPQAGSYGVLHVSEREIETWMTQGGIVDPASTRKFDISDCFFDPGAYPLLPDGNNGLIVPPINTDRIEMRTRLGTSFVSVLDDGSVEIQAIAGTITMSVAGEIELANATGSVTLKTTGVAEVNSSVDAAGLASKIDLLWTTLDTVFRTAWTPVPTDGGAALKTAYLAAFATPPTTVASTKLKVDA
jgi:hypothetical protein